jgi:hypothetical protein
MTIKEEAPARYRVTAPYVTVKTEGDIGIGTRRNGYVILGFDRGALLPTTADPAAVARLLARGQVEPVEGSE